MSIFSVLELTEECKNAKPTLKLAESALEIKVDPPTKIENEISCVKILSILYILLHIYFRGIVVIDVGVCKAGQALTLHQNSSDWSWC